MSWQDWFYVPSQEDVADIKGRLGFAERNIQTLYNRQEKIMATVQDLVTSLNTLRESVKKLAAGKIEGQQQLQEARNIIEETTKIADDAAADDASQGGSTGGGSGATG